MYGEKVYYIDDRPTPSAGAPARRPSSKRGGSVSAAVVSDDAPPIRLAARRVKSNKNPGLAAMLSAFFWGVGQIYADRLVPGMAFLLLQGVLGFAFAVTPSVAESIAPWVRSHHFDEAMLLLSAGGIFTAVAIAWYGNVIQAYRSALNERREPFEGVDSALTIILGGSIVPGLGQLLNGQFKKGVAFLFISMLWLLSGMMSLFACLIWSQLTQINSLMWGEIFLLAFPVMSVIAIATLFVGFVDAVKTNLYPERRAPIWRRIKWSFNRLRNEGLADAVLPLLKRGALALLLLLAGNIAIYFFPRDFYMLHLNAITKMATEHRMTVIPTLLMTATHSLIGDSEAGQPAASPEASNDSLERGFSVSSLFQ